MRRKRKRAGEARLCLSVTRFSFDVTTAREEFGMSKAELGRFVAREMGMEDARGEGLAIAAVYRVETQGCGQSGRYFLPLCRALGLEPGDYPED